MDIDPTEKPSTAHRHGITLDVGSVQCEMVEGD